MCNCFVSGETLPLATSNQIMLRFNAKSGQSARGFHFVYQGNSHFVCLLPLFHCVVPTQFTSALVTFFLFPLVKIWHLVWF